MMNLNSGKEMFVLGLLAFGGISSALAVAPQSQRQWIVDLDRGTGDVEFRAVGRPSALKIVGKGAEPKGVFTIDAGKVSGSAVFDLTSLDTGISMRNEHMKKKYLETSKYPQAKLTLTRLELPKEDLANDFSLDKVPFQGVLTLHGTEKPVSGTAQVSRKGNQVKFLAQFGLDIGDYGIPSPGFAGITMAKDVQVTVESSAPLTVKQ